MVPHMPAPRSSADGPPRRGHVYKAGELEVILSLAPTSVNIRHLAQLLERSEEAITLVYRLAYDYGPFGATADAQRRKVRKAKMRVGIEIGPA